MLLRLAVGIAFCLIAASRVRAEPPSPTGDGTPLGIRQQRVERMMADVEAKFRSLVLALRMSEPEQAKRLEQTLNRAKELLLQQRMDDIARLLNEAKLDTAGESQEALLTDIRALLTLLLEQPSDEDKAREEYVRLSEWRGEIQKIMEAERAQARESERLAERPEALAAMAPEAFDSLARSQDRTLRQTDALQAKMQAGKNPPASDSDPVGPQRDSEATAPPGQEKLAEAQKAMRQASGGLQKGKPGEANRNQKEAIEKLLAALREIDERLSELRDAAQRNTLAELENSFREMLALQQKLTAQTAELETKRLAAGGQLTRRDRNAVRAIGDEQRRLEAIKNDAETKEPGLAGRAQQALDVLLEDGTSEVFPSLVLQLRDDFVAIGNRLADDLRPDQVTATMQRDAETTLAELINSLQKSQSQKDGREATAGKGSGGGGGSRPRLLSTSAELKLLRAAQLRINRGTAALDQARAGGTAMNAVIQKEAARLAQHQQEIAEMATKIVERGP